MRTRLLVALVGTAAVAIVAFAVPLALVERTRIRSESDSSLVREVSRVARIAPVDVIANPAALRLEEQTQEQTEERTIALYDLSQRRVSGAGPDIGDAPVEAALVDGEPHVGTRAGLRVAADALRDGTRVTGVVRVAEPTQVISVRVRERMFLITLRALAVLALATAVAYAAAHRLVKPISQLRLGAIRLGDGDFTARVPPTRIREMDEAARALNAAAVRIGDLVERERAFSADVSHQLRGPITGLRTVLEAELFAPRESQESVITDALDDLDRLEETVTHLLALTRDLPVDRDVIDVAAVVERVVSRQRSRYSANRRMLKLNVPEGGDRRAMFSRSALENVVTVLLDNALEHGNGTVTVTVGGHEGTDVTVTVDDQGPGLKDVETAFARRAPGARGHGIGLSLAATLAHAEGGRLSLDAPGPSPRFRLVLPLRLEAPTVRRLRADRS